MSRLATSPATYGRAGRWRRHAWREHTSQLAGTPIRECERCGVRETYWDDVAHGVPVCGAYVRETYADGYGLWHAEVCQASDAAHARRLARAAIRRELARRGDLAPGYRVRVQLAEVSPDGYGAYSLWRER